MSTFLQEIENIILVYKTRWFLSSQCFHFHDLVDVVVILVVDCISESSCNFRYNRVGASEWPSIYIVSIDRGQTALCVIMRYIFIIKLISEWGKIIKCLWKWSTRLSLFFFFTNALRYTLIFFYLVIIHLL